MCITPFCLYFEMSLLNTFRPKFISNTINSNMVIIYIRKYYFYQRKDDLNTLNIKKNIVIIIY